MEEKVARYRKRHKKCIYCKYLKLTQPKMGIEYVNPYYQCLAKDKIICSVMPDMTVIPRLFCSCYEVDINK